MISVYLLHAMVALTPQLDTLINLTPRDTVSHEFHNHTQRLDILVARLIVKEEHLLIRDTRALVQTRKMCRLASWIDFQLVEQ